jgi:hypothetical protein
MPPILKAAISLPRRVKRTASIPRLSRSTCQSKLLCLATTLAAAAASRPCTSAAAAAAAAAAATAAAVWPGFEGIQQAAIVLPAKAYCVGVWEVDDTVGLQNVSYLLALVR